MLQRGIITSLEDMNLEASGIEVGQKVIVHYDGKRCTATEAECDVASSGLACQSGCMVTFVNSKRRLSLDENNNSRWDACGMLTGLQLGDPKNSRRHRLKGKR